MRTELVLNTGQYFELLQRDLAEVRVSDFPSRSQNRARLLGVSLPVCREEQLTAPANIHSEHSLARRTLVSPGGFDALAGLSWDERRRLLVVTAALPCAMLDAGGATGDGARGEALRKARMARVAILTRTSVSAPRTRPVDPFAVRSGDVQTPAVLVEESAKQLRARVRAWQQTVGLTGDAIALRDVQHFVHAEVDYLERKLQTQVTQE